MTEELSIEERKSVVKANIERIKADIERIKKENGIKYDVTLLAATKTVPVELINYAIRECGIRYIGENRAQEFNEKYDGIDKSAEQHFIGTLQPNKAKYIVGRVALIHSLDSVSLAEEVNKRSSKLGIKSNALIEINIGHEPEKGGIMPEELSEFYEKMTKYNNIVIKGLMTVAPICSSAEEKIRYFSEMRSIYDNFTAENAEKIPDPVLSMGMSDSYKEAIRCGATMVRLGTALFGKRFYGEKNI